MTDKNFLIVNPKGIMHVVSEEHARARLKIIGWRLATPEEKTAYQEADGNQRHNKPLAKPFTAEPSLEDALPEVEAIAPAVKVKRTKS